MKPERAGLFRHSTLLLLWLIAGGTQSVWPQSDKSKSVECRNRPAAHSGFMDVAPCGYRGATPETASSAATRDRSPSPRGSRSAPNIPVFCRHVTGSGPALGNVDVIYQASN